MTLWDDSLAERGHPWKLSGLLAFLAWFFHA
jgi:hypothetical protein